MKKNRTILTLFIFLFTVLLFFTNFNTPYQKIDSTPSKKIEIRGIYGSPEPFWKKNIRLNELGVNAIFIHDGAITETIMTRAKAEGLKVFAEFATLNGKNYVNQHPEA